LGVNDIVTLHPLYADCSIFVNLAQDTTLTFLKIITK